MDKMLEKELQMFKSMSSDEDYDMIIGEEIKFDDYQRLDYLLSVLGLERLGIYFFEKHGKKFIDKIGILRKIDEEYEGESDVEKYEKWIEEFIGKIQNTKLRDKVLSKINSI